MVLIFVSRHMPQYTYATAFNIFSKAFIATLQEYFLSFNIDNQS